MVNWQEILDVVLKGITIVGLFPLYYMVGLIRKDIEYIKRDLSQVEKRQENLHGKV